jgi:hypothetical protein
MPGQSAFRGASRRRAGSRVASGVALVLVLSMAAAIGVAIPEARVARATVLAADAATYVPSLNNLPPGYREETVDAVGGDLEPTIALRRSFVTLDGNRRVVVDVALGSSIQDAHTMLGARMNQLIRYHGWRITPNAPFGESGFRGNGPAPDGASSAMIAFRIYAVTAEISTTSTTGDLDIPLLDNLARLVERRIWSDPEAVAIQPSLPEAPPQQLPAKDPVVIGPVGAVGPGGMVPPGAEVTGSSSGSAVPGDTIVQMNIVGLDRPWQAGGTLPAPPSNMEYLTVQTQIVVTGQTEVVIALTDFWVNTFDGRSWTPIPGRSPALLAGSVVVGAPSNGWLTFMVPKDQPALQLTWRIRTRQSLSGQGGVEQTLVIPLTIGATASASVGEAAPPAGVPVVPPSSAPTGPGGPASPSGPTAPTTAPGPAGPATTPPGGGRGRGSGLE